MPDTAIAAPGTDAPAPPQERILLGLVGTGIGKSRTPALHEAEASAQGIACIYRIIDLDRPGLGPDSLPRLLDAAEAFGFDGLNVTHPCKQAVLAHLHELSPEAEGLGAVNTVLLRGGRRIGHNTDCTGFQASFRAGLPDARRERVVQMGAGGAGAAVAHALLAEGVGRLVLVDVDPTRAGALAERLGASFGRARIEVGADIGVALDGADGLVNATPIGTAAHPGLPLPEAFLRPSLWVAEIVYFPLVTPLLEAARRIGCRTIDGSGMAIWQAAHAFRLFTGREPEVARMRARFERFDRPA